MIRIIITYKLKKGVNIEDFKKYSLSTDQPIVNSFKEVEDFSVHIVTGTEGQLENAEIFEVIKIESWDAWNKIMESKDMEENLRIWNTLCDKSSIKVIYGNFIE